MAFSLNKVTLIGNVGKDPVVRTAQDGREIASFTVATSESWKDKSTGDRREKTEWHNVVIFSQPLIAIVKNNLHKGSKIYVEGALHSRKWTDQSGAEKITTEIVIQAYNGSIILLDGKHSKSDDHSFEAKPNPFEVEHLDDEIPF